MGTERYREALAAHRDVVRAACAPYSGYEVDYEGDAFFYAFPSAGDAVAAVSGFMAGLDGGPIRVRVGIHTGEPALDPPKYVGLDVHRAARVMAAAHGGQVVLTRDTVQRLPDNVELRDLGEHRFKDLDAPERCYQLQIDGLEQEFPRLRSLYHVTLPVPATPFLGREAELAQVVALLTHHDTRLLTLTGPGGTGKTRLALQAAAAASDHYPDGTTWIPLAPLRDPALAIPTIAQTLEIREQPGHTLTHTIATTLLGKKTLLLLDNAEHLLPNLATDLAALLQQCPTLRLLVTSRERLQLGAETTWPVPTLTEHDGVELFTSRATAAGIHLQPDDTIRELCHRLDQLPLAIELAAARTPLFEPAQILHRLGQRLDVLVGARDSDPRQATLRATVDSSYDLLSSAEKRLFGALAAFDGGCLYDAAVEVTGAEPDILQSLIEKSLVRRRDTSLGPRYWMLETIREYASERLAESDLGERVSERHAAHYAACVAALAQRIRQMDPAALTRADDDAANIRRGLRFALASGRSDLAASYLYGAWCWMVIRGALHEGHGYAHTYARLDHEGLDPLTRFAGNAGISEIFRHVGEWETAIDIKRQMLAEIPALVSGVFHGQNLAELQPALLTDLAHLELDTGDVDAARLHAEQALAIREEAGHPYGVAHALNALVSIAAAKADYREARSLQRRVVALSRDSDFIPADTVFDEITLAEAELLAGESDAARALLTTLDVDKIVRVGDQTGAADTLRAFAMLLASERAFEDAARLLGTYERLMHEVGFSQPVHIAARTREVTADLRRQLGNERFDELASDGAAASAMELIAKLPARLAGSRGVRPLDPDSARPTGRL